MASSLRLFYLFRLLATSYLYVPIFMLFQEARGLSFFQRLALAGIYSVVVVLVEVPTGVLADRIGRRRSMMAGALTMVASCLLAYQATSFGEFAVAEALAALSMALCSGADSAYLFDLLRDHDAAHEYPRRESVASAWHLLGSAVAFAGSGLLAQIDLGLPYLATAGVALVAVGVASRLRDDRPPVRCEPRPRVVATYVRQIGEALRVVRGNRSLRWLIGYSAVVFALLRATVYLYQPFLRERGFGVVAIGLLFAAVYVVASIVAYHTHAWRRRFGAEPMLWALLAGLAASFLLLGAVGGAWVVVLLGVQAVANGVFSPLTKPLLNQQIEDSSRRAAILSVESMCRRAAIGVLALAAGVLGETWALELCGVVAAIGLGLLATTRGRPAASSAVPDAIPVPEVTG